MYVGKEFGSSLKFAFCGSEPGFEYFPSSEFPRPFPERDDERILIFFHSDSDTYFCLFPVTSADAITVRIEQSSVHARYDQPEFVLVPEATSFPSPSRFPAPELNLLKIKD